MTITETLEYKIDLPQGVSATLVNGLLTIRGPKGQLKRTFLDDRVHMSLEGNKIIINVSLPDRKDLALAGTWNAHIRNMIKGVQEGYVYKLKIVYAHFPMKVNIKGKEVIIENFLGEKTPRKAEIFGDVKVEVKNDIVTVTGINIEEVGQTAANIERATKIKNYDPRVFQDGIYIISKGDE
ncbi:MAG: 50S ribosomal protein L6 [Thermoplasmata archaeon]|nr:50S ribosomal protein L6 [Thermoplasmata archaeon]